MSIADVTRHDLLTVRRSLLLKTVLSVLGAAPVVGIAVGFVLSDDLTPRFLLLSMWLVVSGTVPLVALLTTAPTIAAGRESGRLRLLFTSSLGRPTFVTGTLCSRLLVVEGSLLVGFACASGILLVLSLPVSLGALAGFVGFTLLLAATYVSLGVAISTMTNSQTRAVGLALGLFVATLFWPRVAGILHTVLIAATGLPFSETTFDIVGRLSPFGAYSQVISDAGAIYGVAPTTPLLGSGAMATVLVAWTVLPLLVSYRRFSDTTL